MVDVKFRVGTRYVEIHSTCESHPGDLARNKSTLSREHRHGYSFIGFGFFCLALQLEHRENEAKAQLATVA